MTHAGPDTGAAIELVVAVARNGVIGSDGDMPWRLSTDLRRFKAITMGKPIIMGRKTYQSIGRPLPGRKNIVVTRDPSFRADGVAVAGSIKAALGAAGQAALEDGQSGICVIGGGEIYRQALPFADAVHLTHVDSAPDGDTVFPELDPREWRAESEESVPASEKDSAATRYVVYRRRTGDHGR